jgi:hypothetical protein
MDEERETRAGDGEDDATSVTGPTGSPPDAGKAYDPEMTDQDEANIPPESDADPED